MPQAAFLTPTPVLKAPSFLTLSTFITMPKRKREVDDEKSAPAANNGAKAQRVRHKLHQGTVKLGHAFKIAKGFERQKISRRRKNAAAQSNAKDVQRIDAEAAAVKVRSNVLIATTRGRVG